MGSFEADGVTYTNPVMAIQNKSGHPAVVASVCDPDFYYQWSADIYGNLTIGTEDPLEALSEVVATYLAVKFPSSNIEPGGQIVTETPSLVFSI